MMQLIRGDCLDKMSLIPDGSIDMVLADPPYGTTQNKWDSVIPLEPMWEHLKRVTKPNAAILLHASHPFTCVLGCSNLKWFRYCWSWRKTSKTGFLDAKRKPLKNVEEVMVFYRKFPTYNPQGVVGCHRISRRSITTNYGKHGDNNLQTQTNYPTISLYFNSEGKTKHPTQKPVALERYLIRTYTNPGDTVLDFCMGSGTTGVACAMLGRGFIGIEKELKYVRIAAKRIQQMKDRQYHE